jgi:uncharacterized protein YbjT (DUF2867 family)
MTGIMLVGATGMVGQAVLRLAPAGSIIPLVRRAVAPPAIVVPTDRWPDEIATASPDVIISCLGTIIKAAGSQAAFRAVDYDLVLAVAQAAKAAGARQCLTVSSVGASANSSGFYLRTKGALEQALRDLHFPRLDILRPGLLTGDRAGPARPGEALAMRAAPFTDALLHGPFRKYRSIPADQVARAIVALTKLTDEGAFVHEHDAIAALAD